MIKNDDIFSNLCHLSKNLWNEALYLCRQTYFRNKYNPDELKQKIPTYNILAGTLKTSENYKSLNAQTAQQTLKLIDRSIKSFFKSIKEYSKHPDKFLGGPKLPNYKPKAGEAILIFTNQQTKIRKGYLTFPKNLNIEPIKTRLPDNTKLCEVRIIPKGVGYICEIVYEKSVESLNLDKSRVIGIDLGLRNIVSIANNIGLVPIVIKGGVLKSINQFYNKRRAELQSIYDHQKIKNGYAIQVLTEKRNRKIKDQMHKISSFVKNYCIQHNIGTVIIGHNNNWKQNISIGKHNNQNFVQIPHTNLIQMITYKLEEIGCKVVEQEEAHTSKCSFLDSETIEHHEIYMGKRITRGIFKSAKGILINADVQGGLNIIRKAIPNVLWTKGIEGVVLHPERLNV